MTEENQTPAEAHSDLIAAAKRVSWKFGHDEAGTPSDWSEWSDLRAAIAAAEAAQSTAEGALTDEQIDKIAEQCNAMDSVCNTYWPRRFAKALLAAAQAHVQPKGTDWTKPTTYRDRFADAVARLCGRRAPDDMVDAWLAPGSEDSRLQEFAIEHGPAWAQGIVLLDAAALMAETPTEGVEHGERPAQAPAPAPADDMLEPLIYAAIMHSGKPKTVADFERAAAGVADMLKRRAQPQPKGTAPLKSEVLLDLAEPMRHLLKGAADWVLVREYGRAVERAALAVQAPAPVAVENGAVFAEAAALFLKVDALLKPHGWPAQKMLRDYVELVKRALREASAAPSPAVVDGPPALPNSFPSIWVPEANQCIDFTLFIREHLENRDDEWRAAIESARATVKESLPVDPLDDLARLNSRRWKFAFIESDNWTYAVCKWDGDDWIPINTAADVQELDEAMAASKPPVQGSQS